MKFLSPRFKRLRIHGVGQFVDGVLETDDPAAIAKVEIVAERYSVHAVRDSLDPFDPAEYDRDTVNAYLATANEAERARVLELEAAGKVRTTILHGAHGTPIVPPNEMRVVSDRAPGDEVFVPADAPPCEA